MILSLFKDKFLHAIHIFMCLLMHIAIIQHLYQKWHHVWIGALLKKPRTSCFLLAKSCFQHFQSSSSTFSWCKAKFDANTAILKCSVLYIGQNQKFSDSHLFWTSHYSVMYLLQAYSNQEMTHHTQLCLQASVKIHASSSSVVLWPEWKLLSHHLYISRFIILLHFTAVVVHIPFYKEVTVFIMFFWPLFFRK